MAPLLIAAGALSGIQLIGGFQQAEMIRSQARLKEQIDEMNADQAEIDAFDAEAAGFSEIARYQSVIDSTVADQRVGYASQGVDVNYGTAQEVQNETRLTGLFNQLDMEKQVREKALGIKREARLIRIGSQASRATAEAAAGAAQFAGITGAAGTALSGYSKFGGQTEVPHKAEKSSTAPTMKSSPYFGSSPRAGTDQSPYGMFSESDNKYVGWWR